ncbi:neural proliferation differentiation and control protein 1 isoform X3 [Sinocyclocheilus grahami]|uniref:neural proliferation differentiation and control protein 1 isoform X3 n=1 Tax=Sinocyclocheilus grahami TaxID=75366 RepID=UPI0007ACEF62|nr:PREDICTED: neural proliferation differentiation and control protein 1-like isoform X3 [Sinocyclocheilus grahami]
MRSLSPPWASLLTEAFLITTVAVSAAMAVVGHCPPSLDCARERRHFCQPGSSHCGPCLDPFVENKRGKCVIRRRNHPAVKVSHLAELDDEIDILSSIISKHRESELKHSAPSPAASKVPEDGSWPSSQHRAEASPTAATSEQPLTSALTTTASSTSPASHTPFISALHSAPFIIQYPSEDHSFIIFLGVFLMVGSVAMVLTGVCWVRMQRDSRLAQKVDYPAFGLIGSSSYDSGKTGDKTLAQSAQMYHFQLQKQQMMSLKQQNDSKIPESGATSDEENEDGDFTVYECPGLAPTGEMEVKNPLFDDSTFHLPLQRSYN